MTGKEWMASVTRLGYAKSLDDLEDLFFEAANLSLCQITRLFPLTASATVTPARAPGYYIPVPGDGLSPRFLAFAHLPLQSGGTPLIPGRDYLLHGGELRIAAPFAGVPLTVFFHERPVKLTRNNLDQPVSCPAMAEHLLPLLTAAILFAQDDPDLADRYHTLYRNALAELQKNRPACCGSGYSVTGGWDQ